MGCDIFVAHILEMVRRVINEKGRAVSMSQLVESLFVIHQTVFSMTRRADGMSESLFL